MTERTIFESHRETRENLTGKLETGTVVRAPYDDVVVIEEGVTVISILTPAHGWILDHPVYGQIDNPNNVFDYEPPETETYVIPNHNCDFIERFRTDWFKPDEMPSGVVWDTENHELRW